MNETSRKTKEQIEIKRSGATELFLDYARDRELPLGRSIRAVPLSEMIETLRLRD